MKSRPCPPAETTPSAGPVFRVALLAGTLERGGAEKQLVYTAESLRDAGVAVKVFSLRKYGYHVDVLRSAGIDVEFTGRGPSPIIRLALVARSIRRFRPHVIQCGHFFTNVYASVAARLSGAVEFGAARSDIDREFAGNKTRARACLTCPRHLIVNSHPAQQRAIQLGARPGYVSVLSNVIDIQAFDREAARQPHPPLDGEGRCVAIAVGSLLPEKGLDTFIRAVALAQRNTPNLTAYIVGDGPERSRLERLAAEASVLGTHLKLLGGRDDVPALMAASNLLVLTSEHEGFPNVILEAMTARLPVVTTPAGEAPLVVEDHVSGFVVDQDDVGQLAQRMVLLASSPELRAKMGSEGRRKVEADFSHERLGQRVLDIYLSSARSSGRTCLERILAELMVEKQSPVAKLNS